MTQSFGPEARGSACSAQLIVSDEQIDYPYVRQVDTLVAMSQEGFDLHAPGLGDKGQLIYEQDLVDLRKYAGREHNFACPATRIAEDLGRRIVQNMAMLGFVTAVTELFAMDSVKAAIRDSVPAGTETLNLRAFEDGYEYLRDPGRLGNRGRHSGDTVGA